MKVKKVKFGYSSWCGVVNTRENDFFFFHNKRRNRSYFIMDSKGTWQGYMARVHKVKDN